MLDSPIMLSMVSPWQFPVGFHLLVGGVVQLPFNLCMTFFQYALSAFSETHMLHPALTEKSTYTGEEPLPCLFQGP